MKLLFILFVVIFELALSWNQLQGPIMLAVLLPKDNRRPFSIHQIQPAIDIAVEKVLAANGLLHGQQIEINYADSMCDSADSMKEAINFYIENKSHIFFGPCCDYAAAPVGRQTKYWNIPMITTAMARDFAEAKTDKYPMMTRIGSSINKMADFFAVIFREFRWSRVKILYQPNGLNYLADRMCHVTAESLHYVLSDKYKHYVPYYKFETTQEVLTIMQIEIGIEHAGIGDRHLLNVNVMRAIKSKWITTNCQIPSPLHD